MASKKPETKFKEKAVKDLKRLPQTWVVKTQQVSVCGTPDLLICHKGMFIAIELKSTENDDPTPLQERNLNLIAEAGGLSYVAHPGNWVAVLASLQKLIKCN